MKDQASVDANHQLESGLVEHTSGCSEEGSIATATPATDATSYKVVKFESTSERQRSVSAARNDCHSLMPTQLIHPTEEGESDSDEPLLSGSGEVGAKPELLCIYLCLQI